MDDVSKKLIDAFLSDPKIKLYREKFPQIDALAVAMAQSHDRKYIHLIMAEIKHEMTDFQKNLGNYILPILGVIFADRNIPGHLWVGLYANCYNGFDLTLMRSLLAVKLYLENLIEPVQDAALQEKYLKNFRYGANRQEQEIFDQINVNYLLKGKLPPLSGELNDSTIA